MMRSISRRDFLTLAIGGTTLAAVSAITEPPKEALADDNVPTTVSYDFSTHNEFGANYYNYEVIGPKDGLAICISPGQAPPKSGNWATMRLEDYAPMRGWTAQQVHNIKSYIYYGRGKRGTFPGYDENNSDFWISGQGTRNPLMSGTLSLWQAVEICIDACIVNEIGQKSFDDQGAYLQPAARHYHDACVSEQYTHDPKIDQLGVFVFNQSGSNWRNETVYNWDMPTQIMLGAVFEQTFSGFLHIQKQLDI